MRDLRQKERKHKTQTLGQDHTPPPTSVTLLQWNSTLSETPLNRKSLPWAWKTKWETTMIWA